jgi:hypothetical protein
MLEPIVQFARARDAWAPKHDAALGRDATALQKVVWGPPLPSALEGDARAQVALARRVAASAANAALLEATAAEVLAASNRGAFDAVLAAVRDAPPPALLPVVTLYAGGNAADNELVFPPLLRELRRV